MGHQLWTVTQVVQRPLRPSSQLHTADTQDTLAKCPRPPAALSPESALSSQLKVTGLLFLEEEGGVGWTDRVLGGPHRIRQCREHCLPRQLGAGMGQGLIQSPASPHTPCRAGMTQRTGRLTLPR